MVVVLDQVRGDDGPWLPETVSDQTPVNPQLDRDSLYAGIAGLAPVLTEIAQQRPLADDEQALAAGIADRLSAMAVIRADPSLYDGLAGDVTALRMLSPGREQAAMRRLAELRTPAGWNEYTDVVTGTAGIVLTAAWAGGDDAADVMTTGGEALLSVAEPTEAGLDWRMRPGYPASSPNFSHGTAGAASALAIAGHLLGREDFIDAARRGAQHLLSVGWLDDGGFVIRIRLPYSKREVEPVTYNWCHGPTGTSHFFAALALAGVTDVGGFEVSALRQRCLHSILTCGLPERLRPGFWDNDGRCCGTAGVGDVLLDAAQDAADRAHYDLFLHAAQAMGDALLDRAVRDDAGTRWQFIEYRQEEPLLPPGTSWMQGAAGIAAFLLRLARVMEQGPAAPSSTAPTSGGPSLKAYARLWRMAERLILVNGLPGAGKSTLAAKLGAALGVPVISKDAIKEALYAAVPTARPRALGATAMDAAWSLAADAEGTVVLESWWFRPRDLGYAEAGWHRCGRPDLVEVWCDVPPEVAYARFTARVRSDEVYEDADRAATWWDDWAAGAMPLAIGSVVRVDTSTEVDIAALAQSLSPS